jgi:putative flippase GtrA
MFGLSIQKMSIMKRLSSLDLSDKQLKVKQVLYDKTDDTNVQLFRFLLTGGSAFVLDTSALVICHEILKLPLQFSVFVGSVIGIIYTFYLSRHWIFANKKQQNKRKELIAFIALSLVGILINQVVLFFSRYTPNISYLVFKVLAVGLAMIWNFTARKYILYK